MAEMIPNSSFEVIAGTAHLSAVEAPEQWAGIVGAFLDRILGS
jgi:pimeloyl-ACP methyl ester carboxylesterase